MMRFLLKCSTLFIFILYFPFTYLLAYQEIAGDISGQTLQSDSTYIITNDIYVSTNMDLTIQPGVVLKFNNGYLLRVEGTIYVNGSDSNPVVFTSINDNSYGEIPPASSALPQPGDWDGIYLYGYSGNQGIGYFEYCRIRFGGNPNGTAKANICFYKSDTARIANSVVEFSETDGIILSNCIPEVTDNQLDENNRYPLFVDNCNLTGYPGNQGSGNGNNCIAMTGYVADDQTWTTGPANLPYVLLDRITVYSNATLEVEAGAILKYVNNADFYVEGTLRAIGTEENEIVFTSYTDDAYGGDSNGDGAVSSPDSNHWGGIYLYGYSGNQGIGYFEHCRILYGGSSNGTAQANLRFYKSDTARIASSVSEYSETDGIRVSNCEPEVEQNQLNQNNRYPLLVEDCNLIGYPGNQGSGNGKNCIAMTGYVSDTQFWPATPANLPYFLLDRITVNANAQLEIGGGAILKFVKDADLYVQGTLKAVGIRENEIVFTSYADDDFGGDSNGDGAASSPDSNHWGGIYLYGYSGNQGIGYFDICRLRYGGNPAAGAASNLLFYKSDTGRIANSIVEYSETDGIRVSNCEPEIEQNQMNENNRYPLFVEDCNLIGYPGNEGSGNGMNCIAMTGYVSGHQTWPASPINLPYVLLERINVYSNATLEIKPASVLKFVNDADMYVEGTLEAMGTDQNQIVFTSFTDDAYGGDSNGDGAATSPDDNHWEGLYLYGYSGDQGIGYFDHCRIRYGGNPGGVAKSNLLFYKSDTGRIANSLVELSQTDGIRVTNCEAVVMQNQLDHNAGYPLYIKDSNLIGYPGNQGSGNGKNGIAMTGYVTGDQTWPAGPANLPYVILDRIFIYANDNLTIQAGSILKFADNVDLYVEGKLQAPGMEDNEIIFTSIADDIYGGDSNGDGIRTSPDTSLWDGIYLYGYSGNRGIGYFDYSRIRYAGRDAGTAKSGVYCNKSDSVRFSNCRIEKGGFYGMRIYDAAPIVRKSRFENNLKYGVYIDPYPNVVPDFGQNDPALKGENTFLGNDSGRIQFYNNSASDINAFFNYWGYQSQTEIAAHIIDYEDHNDLGHLFFEPWLDTDPTFTQSLYINLLAPVNGDTLRMLDSLRFVWQPDPYPEGPPLSYQLVIHSDEKDTLITVTGDTSFLFLNTNFLQYERQYSWTIGIDDTLYSAIAPAFTFYTPVPVAIVEEENGIPGTYALYANYPNPFNPVTTIRFDLPNASPVRIDIYDTLGRLVKTLINGKKQAGRYKFQFNGNGLSSGQYFVVMKSRGFFKVHKMLLLK